MSCICGRHIAQRDPGAKVNKASIGEMRVLTCDRHRQVGLALFEAAWVDRAEAWDYALYCDSRLSGVASRIEGLNHNRVRSLQNGHDAIECGARHRRWRPLTSNRSNAR